MRACIFLFLTLLAWPSATFAAEFKSTVSDQKSIQVTVYNSNLGLIKDTRFLKMDSGRQELQFMDVASAINPVTVHIKSLTLPEQLTVLEQNYEYDLLNPSKLMGKYVGQKVKLLKENYYTGAKEVMDAELLSDNEGTIYKINGEIHVNPSAQIIYPSIPENLIAKPTLIWLLENANQNQQEVEVSYLTGGISWKADYTVVLNDESTVCDLSGWVTIDNRSGGTYKDATIKLIAGDVNRAQEYPEEAYSMMADARLGVQAKASSFGEESFFEYHLYTLDRPATIKDRQTKQIELLSADQIPVTERLIYYGDRYYYRSQMTGEMLANQKIGAYIEIENKKENRLGIPLPKGVIRAYKKDKDGFLQFIGEDNIDHTPKDEKLKIKMGDAFDVVGERKETDYKILSRDVSQRFDVEQAWEIKVTNHKETPCTVDVVEPLYSDWEMVDSSHPFDKIEAHTIKFTLNLQKDESQTITYRVKIRWW